MHFVGILKNKENQIAAIFETILGHIDLKKGKLLIFLMKISTYIECM